MPSSGASPRHARREPWRHRLRVRRRGRARFRGRGAARDGAAPRADRRGLRSSRRSPSGDRRGGAPPRCEGSRRTADDRAAGRARGVRSRSGRAALRAAAADLRRHTVGDEAGVRHRRRCRDRHHRSARLADHRPADQGDVPRAGALSGCASRPRRARLPHAEVPHDGRRRCGPAERARRGQRGIGCALQDPRRSARHSGRTRAAPLLARRGAERAQRAPR